MTTEAPARASDDVDRDADDRSLYLKLTYGLQVILVIALIVAAVKRQWENAFLTAAVIVLTLLPAFLWRRYRVTIPPEFQFVSALFTFLSLFVGSVAGYYSKYWWWDIMLHTSSGFLLGIIGFLALFLLNRTDRIPQGMKPGFLCFFAVTFAVFLGVVWEVFEFACDRISPGMDMQSQKSGVVDTMVDLIVDTLGAVVVALMGYAYLKTGRYSFVADGVRKFLKKNPSLFHRRARGA